jgi:hypothetical protein
MHGIVSEKCKDVSFLVLFIVHTVSNFPDAPDINVIFSVIEL